jgi:hypothetical protein
VPTEAPTWKAMLRRLYARYGLIMDQSTRLLAGMYDPAWSADIFIPGRSVGFCVCVLGPYYGRHERAPGRAGANTPW